MSFCMVFQKKDSYSSHVMSVESSQNYLEKWLKKVNSNIEFFYLYIAARAFHMTQIKCDFTKTKECGRKEKSLIMGMFLQSDYSVSNR